jgi:hypothetical protein
MKLAEALILRGDAQKRLEQLRSRAFAAARYQEGEKPAESVKTLIQEADRVIDELEGLIRRINRTNASVQLARGEGTITDAIARRDALKLRHAFHVGVTDAAVAPENPYRQLRSELRYMTDLSVADERRRADELARELRELDSRIQQRNWEVDLAD